MTTIKDLLKHHNIEITIPETWQKYIVDEEAEEYTYHTETDQGNTIHVLRTPSYDRAGEEAYDEIIIDPTMNRITFLGADGVLTQYDEKGNVTDSTV